MTTKKIIRREHDRLRLCVPAGWTKQMVESFATEQQRPPDGRIWVSSQDKHWAWNQCPLHPLSTHVFVLAR